MGPRHDEGVRAEPAQGERPFIAEVVAQDAALRRDLATCLQVGISPHRLSGWEPEQHTRFVYNADGLLLEATTTREPEWDDIDRALIDAYLTWKADLHTCGRPLSESLHDPDSDEPDPDYQVGTETCRACMALDRWHADQAKNDEPLRKAGRNPDSWRLRTVLPFAELPAEEREAITANRRRREAERERR